MPDGVKGSAGAYVDCQPPSGVVPFSTTIAVTLGNLYPNQWISLEAYPDLTYGANVAAGRF